MMGIRQIRRIALISTLLCIAAANAVYAASFTYSVQPKKIRAGVLILKDINSPYYPDPRDRPDPYVFYVMDARQDLKPSGWLIYNPLASSNVTNDIYARWRTVEVADSPGERRPYVYETGQSITKEMGCYWEVPIDTPSDDLAQYDILLLTHYGTLDFSRKDREKLRKFVDSGGILWIEHRKPPIIGEETQFNSSFFLRGLEFDPSSGAGTPPPPAMTAPTARAHSLVSRPFLLLWKDIGMLGRGRLDPNGVYFPDYYNTSIVLNSGANPDAHRYLFPIIMRKNNPIVAAAQYGSGYVVVSAESIGQAISEPLGRAAVNDGTYKGLLPAANSEDLRFAYNIVSWGSEHTTFHKGARRTGYSFAEIGSPLRPLWTYNTPSNPSDCSPAILDDIIFYVDGLNILHAFDLSPVRDRDLDGNPDDGIPDYSRGAEYDELWRYPLTERSSSPTVAYVPKGSAVVPTVFVQTQSGQVMGFDASLPNPSPDLYFTGPNVRLQACDPADRPIPSPTYVDGALYVGDGYGIMHVHRFFPTEEWVYPTLASVGGNRPGIANSPTVGYLHDAVTGATEQVAYLAQQSNTSTDGNVKAYPIKVFNEALTLINPTANPGLYRTRSFNTPILEDTTTWRVYYDAGSGPVEIPQGAAGVVVLNPGRFQIVAGFPIPAGATVIADYQLDYNYSTTPGGQPFYRLIDIQKSGVPGGQKAGVTGSVAASKKDIIYFATDNRSIYAVKESGIPQTNEPPLIYKWRWCLQDPSAASFLVGIPVPVGSPAVANDLVYFAANDDNQGYILAFKADPEFVIRLGEPINRGNRILVRQLDAIKSAGGNQPYDYTGIVTTDPNKIPPNAVFLINYEMGELRFVNFRLTGGGQMTVSQDMTVIYTPAPKNPNDVVVEVEKPIPAFNPGPNNTWNNLVWFMRIPARITSSPMVMGDILYMGLWDGRLAAIDLAHSSIPKEGPGEVQWMPGGNAWAGYPMPNSVPGAEPPIEGTVAGSHGMLGVVTPKGLGVLYSPVTLVTEPDQIAEIDAGSRKTWICDATTSYTGTSTATDTDSGSPVFGATKTPFNKPSVARRASIGGTIVADTGNNRVVHIDRAGTVLWEITDFMDLGDSSGNPLLPPGSSLSLNKPTDVSLRASTEPDDPADPAGPTHPAYHYLIVDSGNYRVVEIIAKFISQSEAARLTLLLQKNVPANTYQNVLRWTSKTLAQGKQYRFATARPVYLPDQTQSNPCMSPPLMALVCAVSKFDTNDGATGISGGGLLKIDMATQKAQMITELPIEGFQDPGTYSQPNPDPLLACSGTVNNASHNPANPGAFLPPVHLYDPVFFNRQYISKTEFHDLVIDAVGVHVVSYTPSPTSGNIELTTRTYKITDHRDASGNLRPFVPSYAQYLPNGNVLVTSRATNPSGQSYGEVFEIEPVPLALDSTRTGMRLVPNSTIFNVRQPLSAERQIF